jgi:hypothetical protein
MKVSVNLTIEDTDEGRVLIFSHNGNPFRKSKKKYRFDDFKNLINPVSGKSQDDKKTIGKFGTGFLSTHKLSLKVDVKGIFENSADDRFQIQTCLDRRDFTVTTDDARNNRVESIISSLGEYEKSKNEKKAIENTPVAEFKYHLKHNKEQDIEISQKYLDDGLKEIEQSLPLVFAFTNKVACVDIYDKINDNHISYNRSEDEFSIDEIEIKSTIKKERGNDPITFSVAKIKNENNDVEIAWRINEYDPASKKLYCINSRSEYKKALNHELHNLYCTFPLIGSHDFKFPVSIHSSKFHPSETRDGVSFKDDDVDNWAIIDKAIKLYETLLSEYSEYMEHASFICDTLNDVPEEHKWIDKKFYQSRIEKLRDAILKANLIVTSNDSNYKKPILSDSNQPNVFFPAQAITTSEGIDVELEKSKFYNFARDLFADQIPLEKEVNNWLNILWDSKSIRRLKIRDIINKIRSAQTLEIFEQYLIEKRKFDTRETAEGQNTTANKWLSNLYNFILDVLKEPSLLDFAEDNSEVGIVPARSGRLKLFKNLKKDTGLNGKIIDDELLNVYDDFHNIKDFYKDKLLPGESEFERLNEEKKEELLQENVEVEVKKKTENFLDELDSILKKQASASSENRNSSTEFLEETKRINEIKDKLSLLQRWIAKGNISGVHFNNHIKRKVLQAIISEEKSESLTKLLELDRNEVYTLEEQTEILSDEDLEEKLEKGQILLDAIKEENEKFEKLKQIGEHFERYMKEILIKSFGEHRVHHIDGNQDFIIGEYHIELKTTRGGDHIKMHPRQARTAKDKGDKYYLCVFQYHKSYEQVTKEEFEEGIKFTNEIGVKLNEIVVNMILKNA